MATFSRCKKAELTDPVSKRKITAGVSVGPMNSLMVAIPLSCKIDSREPIAIRFLDPTMGVVTCRCQLTSPLLTESKRILIYRCQVLEQLSQEQRREDIKIPLNVQVLATLSSSNSSAPASLRDISASGVYLGSSLSAKKGDRITFKLPIDGKVIPLTAEVLRLETRPELGGFGYGCRFVHLSPQYESQLRAFIFKEERRLFRAQKG